MVANLLYGQNVIRFVYLTVLDKKYIASLKGKNLKRLREVGGLTQDQLGELITPTIDGAHIAAIESGRGVSDKTLAKLCSVLKVRPREFFFEESEQGVQPLTIKEARAVYAAREIEKIGKHAEDQLELIFGMLDAIINKESQAVSNLAELKRREDIKRRKQKTSR